MPYDLAHLAQWYTPRTVMASSVLLQLVATTY
jgi:hypothetical protein